MSQKHYKGIVRPERKKILALFMLFQACMTFFKHKRSYFEEYILNSQTVLG